MELPKQEKNLALLIAQDGLYACVSHADTEVPQCYEHAFSSPLNPENLLKEVQLFLTNTVEKDNASFSEVNVFYAHPLFAVVPRPYFDERKLSDYLKFNAKLLPTDELAYDPLEELNANVVYIPYTNINNYLIDKYGEFTYQHAVSEFSSQCYVESKTIDNDEQVYVNVFTTHFDVCIIKAGELLLCNSYNYFSPEDFVYYILFAFEQLKLDRETLQLYLCGAVEKNDAVYDLLYTYVRYVSFLTPKEADDAEAKDSATHKSQSHKYRLLLNTLTCA